VQLKALGQEVRVCAPPDFRGGSQGLRRHRARRIPGGRRAHGGRAAGNPLRHGRLLPDPAALPAPRATRVPHAGGDSGGRDGRR
jgi:hypothetical protein